MTGNTPLVETMNRIDVILQCPVFVLSCTILLLSVKVVPSSLARMYCANIAVQSFMCTLAYLIGCVFFPGFRNQEQQKGFVQQYKVIYVFMRTATINGYLYFSTLTVFLAYIGYTRPLHFSRLFKKATFLFLIGYLWTIVNVFLKLPRTYMPYIIALHGVSNFAAPMWIHLALNTVLYGCMIALYVMTISQIQSIRHELQTSNSSSSAKIHWNTLKSILIYCTPPNVFAVVALAGYTCDTVTETLGLNEISNWESKAEYIVWRKNGDVCGNIRVWSQGAANIRVFVSLFTALIAFREYRLPLISLAKRLWYYMKLIGFKMLPGHTTPPEIPQSSKIVPVNRSAEQQS